MRRPVSFIPAVLSWPSARPAGRTGCMNSNMMAIACKFMCVMAMCVFFTMNGANWTDRYRLIVEEAAKLKVSAIIDAEVVCTDGKGVPDFDRLHSRTNDHLAFACAFDLLMLGGEDLRRLPLAKRKAALRRLLKAERGGIQYVEHTEGDGDKMFDAVCKLGLEGIVSKRAGSFYRSGPSKMWIKVKNPNSPAATRVLEGSW
jgi:bifunctional non-homologous end joining protein LigD